MDSPAAAADDDPASTAGHALAAGALNPRRLQVHRQPPKRDVPYVPTDEPVLAAMLRFAHVGPEDVVYDLGCGDGRIVIAAAKFCGARAVGVDIDPQRIRESRENAKTARVTDRVRFLCQSFFETDLREATVVMLYLLPSINARLRPKLLNELRPGTRIVANYFEMGDWQADIQANAHHRLLHQWIVPASVAGTWKCVMNRDRSQRRGGRWHLALQLQRRYQQVSGTAWIEGRQIAVTNGRLFGDQLSFKLYDPQYRRPVWRFGGRVEGSQVRGTWQIGFDNESFAWGGRRVSPP